MNAPPLVETHGEVDPLKIAQKELNEKKVNNIMTIQFQLNGFYIIMIM